MNIPDVRKIMLFPWQVQYDMCELLMEMGFEIIENPNVTEVKTSFGINFVALAPGKVVMPAGNPKTRNLLEKAGIECIEVCLTELMKCWGAAHCLTAFLRRDSVG